MISLVNRLQPLSGNRLGQMAHLIMTDQQWMTKAIELAELAAHREEVPVGAIIVIHEKIIGQGFNQTRSKHDPSAHAEIEAIRQACQHMENERLPGATLYVTLEPCVMCMGALLHARIDRLVFGTRDFRAGAAGSKLNLASGIEAYGQVQVDEGICQAACASLLTQFFLPKRLS